MPTVTEAIEARFKVDTSGMDRGLKKMQKSTASVTKKASSNMATFGLAVVGAAGAFSAFSIAKRAASFIFDVNRETEKLMASLETVTGSTEMATKAFAGITQFAAETPFQVGQIADAFIKLKALGLEPTEEALRSFGNTSSAMGKSLNQMIEAVADASTGEFERLKEFGIKSKSEGDKVKFTFQGVTTTVQKNAKAISGYLQQIGENQFAGDMNKQMGTMNGIISNATDNLEGLARIIGGEGGVNTKVKEVLMSFRDWTGELIKNRSIVAGWTNITVTAFEAVFNSISNIGKIAVNVGQMLGRVFLLPLTGLFNFVDGLGNGKSFMEALTDAGSIMNNDMKIDMQDIGNAWSSMLDQSDSSLKAFNDLMSVSEEAATGAASLNDALGDPDKKARALGVALELVENTSAAIAENLREWSEDQTFFNDVKLTLPPLKGLEEASAKVTAHINDANGEGSKFLNNTMDGADGWQRISDLINGVDDSLSGLIDKTNSWKDVAKGIWDFGLDKAEDWVPGGSSIRSGLKKLPGIGRFFKTGSAGTVGQGPIPMASNGMLVPSMPSNKTMMIGVHDSESVLNKRATAAIGPGNIAAMNRNPSNASMGSVTIGDITIHTVSSDAKGIMREFRSELPGAIRDAMRKGRL